MPESPIEILPLFPLNVVLFPQSQLHLHIFENRYKTLIGECVSYDTVFGINFVSEQDVQKIGCTATVKEVVKRYDDGTMDIVVEGRRRYHLHNFVKAPHPYFCGSVSWVEDVSEEVDDELRMKAVQLHNQFVSVVFAGIVEQVRVDDIRKTRAFHLVQKAGMELQQRQTMLAMTSENTRLQFLIRHLESLIPLLSSKKSVEVFAKNDGYIRE
ncbi:MAG: LON peptidase substrate-binding domain-containing protein [Bacteriovoracaceae bacterium]|nr:LON peptidase substrate-binding domain-containing protein [Bacteroidota bacterium]